MSSRTKIQHMWSSRCHLRMVIPLSFIFLSFLYFLQDIHCSCLNHFAKCGGINITFPFILETTARPSNSNTAVLDACSGSYPVQCSYDSNLKIKLEGRAFAVKNISYETKVLIVQDDTLTNYFSQVNCGFLEFMTDPVDHFHLPNHFQLQNFSQSVPDCRYDPHRVFRNFIARSYEYGKCIPHVLYIWDEMKEELQEATHRANCVRQQAAMFEWVLSFNEDDGSLSLESAGFSHMFELRKDCFNCQTWGGKNCSRNNGPIDSLCLCGNGCKSNSTVLPSKGKVRAGKYIGIGAGVVGALVLGCISVIIYKRRKRLQQSRSSNLLSGSISSKISSKNDTELGASNYHTHIFSYDELEEATNGFNTSGELGDGGFGTVYKGKLKDGRTVAVKRLYEHNYRRLEQFMNEVEILSRLRHQHLVTLYGCTSRHSRELLLVYEYIPNGTVADHLHGSKCTLPWPVRMSISIETADALAYLHAVEPQIIHRDVKTSNILLDNNYHVKVADFGLSRLFPLDATHVSTAPQGTPGYVDPEYHQCYQLTDKSDVYSFGVVLVELISSKPAVDISRHRNEINLANLAVTKIQNCKIHELVDPELGYDEDLEVKRMIDQVAEVAFRCLQLDSEMRPSIREVLDVLRGIEDGEYKAEKEGDGNEAHTKEESRLLKNVLPFSPDTVAERWQSRSTTPSTST